MSRRLHGRRGLKSKGTGDLTIPDKSPPSRAAWIEINAAWHNLDLQAGRRLHGRRGLKSAGTFTTSQPPPSPPSRAAWIEILRSRLPPRPTRSPPSRAAWIEIGVGELGKERLCVAAFTGGVD